MVRKGITGGVKNWLRFFTRNEDVRHRNQKLRTAYLLQKTIGRNPFLLQHKPEEEKKCLVLERVRGNKEYPFVSFISYFNPEIPLTGDEDFTQPLYGTLESTYNIIVKTSKEEISARLAGEFIAEKLDIKSSDPILIRKRFVYDIKGTPIEYNIGYYRADSFTYTIEAER